MADKVFEIEIPYDTGKFLNSTLTLRDGYEDVETLTIISHGLLNSQTSLTIKNCERIVLDFSSTLTFDFRGCGKSDGKTYYSDYLIQLADLNTIVNYFTNYSHSINSSRTIKFNVKYLIGHSKAGSVVQLYGSTQNSENLSKYTIPYIINLNGRYYLNEMSLHRFKPDVLKRVELGEVVAWSKNVTDGRECYLKQDDFNWRKTFQPEIMFKPAKANIKNRLTVHGKLDRVVPVEDGINFDTLYKKNQVPTDLILLEDCGHIYTKESDVKCLKRVLNEWFKINK